jgi:hypothetical protein
MCKGTIWVDPSTGKVVDHKDTESQPKVNLSDFVKNQKNRGTELENMFKKAKEDQAKRKEELEQQFRKAKENPDELKGDVQSPFQWD